MEISVTKIIHAGYVFSSSAARVAFDPIFESPFSYNCFSFPPVSFDREKLQQEKFDAVFISHIHDDHFSMASLNLLSRDTPIYLYSTVSEAFDLLKQLGFQSIYSITHYVPIQIGDLAIEALPALDRDTDCLFKISNSYFKILNVVDSWIDPWTFSKYIKNTHWDLVLWPFQTMRELESLNPNQHPQADQNIPKELFDQLKELQTHVLIPSACGFQFERGSWLNQFFFPISYKGFIAQAQPILEKTALLRLDPNDEILLEKISESQSSLEYKIQRQKLEWLENLDPTYPDYHYQEHLDIPPLSDFSRSFFVNNHTENSKLVIEWLEQLPTLFPGVAIYDSENQDRMTLKWTLTVYNDGEIFYENTFNENISNMPQLPWSTEIILEKLYSALTTGESLTSLYVRINNRTGPANLQFDDSYCSNDCSEILEQSNVDPLQDPLLRLLYGHDPLVYQKGQFKNL